MTKLLVKKSTINGKGVFTKNYIEKGDLIGYIKGPIVVVRSFTPTLSKQSMNWIGFSRYSWINTDHSIFKNINHSCNPNTYISTRRTIRALKNIQPGLELTMDYSLTEADPGWCISSCNCKTKFCRKFIGNIFSLSLNFIIKNKSRIPRKFFDMYMRQSHLSPTE